MTVTNTNLSRQDRPAADRLRIAGLAADDLPEADRIMRLAFGTFLGLPDPLGFGGDSAYVAPRWRAAPESAFGAWRDGRLVGSIFAARWGSFGLFGPLTIHPEHWGEGIAQRLLKPTMDLFEAWGVRQTGLFTFADSPGHQALYGKYGYRVQQATAVLALPLSDHAPAGPVPDTLSTAAPAVRAGVLAGCRAITDRLFAGLDLGQEIAAVADQGLGDVVLIRRDGAVAGFAVCHCGADSEAGSGAVYAKFAAVAPGPEAAGDFARLLDMLTAYARARGAAQLIAGVNAARAPAYRALLDRGFEPTFVGVAMQRPDEAGFNRPDCWVIDDWR